MSQSTHSGGEYDELLDQVAAAETDKQVFDLLRETPAPHDLLDRAEVRKRLIEILTAKGWQAPADAVDKWLNRDRRDRGILDDYVTGAEHLTDVGNAKRLVARHGEDLRYVPGIGWHAWDEQRWRYDDDGEVMRRAKNTVHWIISEAVDERFCRHRKQIVDWALLSEKESRLRACVSVAEYDQDVIAYTDALDAMPWLLNVANGTVDLRTGELRPHQRSNLITQLAPVTYNPAVVSEEWQQVMSRACRGDGELETFLQRFAGYSATGETREDLIAFLHGPGATGKTTVIEAIGHALGDYAATADFDTFVRRNGSGPRNDIARLRGSRLVCSIEVEEGSHLAEALLKTLTGGDRVTARFLYREAFEFQPRFKLWLVANNRPRVDASDEGVWRRIVQVPFTNVIPEGERDKKLRDRLRTPEAAEAILAWVVKGAIDYYEHGLQVPECVRAYTAEYRAESDPLAVFFEQECVLREGVWESARALRGAYDAWCGRMGEKPVGNQAWGNGLRARGCVREQLTIGDRPSIWRGIELASGGESSA